MFTTIKEKVSGYKTYALCVIAIIGTIVAWSANQITTWEAIQAIFLAMGGVTMRGAVTKSGVATCPPVTTPGGNVVTDATKTSGPDASSDSE